MENRIEKERQKILYTSIIVGDKVREELNKKFEINTNTSTQKIDEGIPADKFSHKELYKLLYKPGITIISEEANNGDLDLSCGYIIDPLDGTGNASGKRPNLKNFYSISIAYFEDGKIKAGVVHFPSLGVTVTDKYRINLEHKDSLENLAVAADTYKDLMTDYEKNRTRNRIDAYESLENRYQWKKNPMFCATGESLRTIGLFNKADIHFSPSLIYAWDFAASSLIMAKNKITTINLETMKELDIINDFQPGFRDAIGTISGPRNLVDKIIKYL